MVFFILTSIFSVELEVSGVTVYREHINRAKNGCFHSCSEEFLEAVLVTFCCCEYGDNTSEAVEKIPTDEKDYHKSSLCVIVCFIGKEYHQ